MNAENTNRRSLAERLSLMVVLFAVLIFVAALGYMFLVSRDSVRREAVDNAFKMLDNTALRVNDILDDAVQAADNVDWLVYRSIDNPDAMFDLSRNVVLNNLQINGCSIAFEPGFYPQKGRYFSAYSGMDGDHVQTVQEGGADYEYFYMDWYQLPKLLGQPCWTEPYTDVDVEDKTVNQITSYCKPLIGDNGDYIGTISVDISLAWLSETISSVRPYPNSYSLMIGRGGSYLVHPDASKLLNMTIFTETLETPDPDLTELGRSMLERETGMKRLLVDGKPTYVFYQPIKETGWSLAIVCPESDIFSGFGRLTRTVLLIVVLGLFLMLLVCSRVISSALEPLNRLARQADVIAAGRFDEALPPTDSTDEIGQLTQSITNMQSSLVNYIDELTRTTASKERMEGELQIAREIQMSMVPRTFPPFPEREELDLYASMTPAKEVGGDLYDYFIDGGKLYLCVGDVSGKGIPGSLLMAVARNLFRVVSQQGHTPAQIARQINETISQDNEKMMFVTMFIAVIDLISGRMDFCNCGHNPPVIVGSDGPKFMSILPNTPLGISTDLEFKGESVKDIRGKTILLYTDGLNEAENIRHEQFGDERILEVLRTVPSHSTRATVESLSARLADFVGEAEPSDDLTMVCLKLRSVAAKAA